MEDEILIRVDGLERHYGDTLAVRGVSLRAYHACVTTHPSMGPVFHWSMVIGHWGIGHWGQ